jgi:hypothetical protein
VFEIVSRMIVLMRRCQFVGGTLLEPAPMIKRLSNG